MKNNKLEQFKSNPYKAIEKLAKRKSEWLKDFKEMYAKNRRDKSNYNNYKIEVNETNNKRDSKAKTVGKIQNSKN